jgi:predicted tellurium resistance membrane protein TerC
MDEKSVSHSIRWLTPLGIAMACLMLAAFVAIVAWLVRVLVMFAVLLVLIACFEAVKAGLRKRDKYDLESLRRFHEKEELRNIDEGEVSATPERTVCPRCGMDYSTRLPVCPHCGHS